eukprot:TRINITY_DN16581_c0_g1_i1.p1 TRINITY_DN16581_c0_g1~~TRINITY_DN16581_c0_g1_i1.p1  ORF type:complete len:542 (+),score=200.07 TRINITY_DN16581_c0_g1_i1:107-1732(+)
MYGYLRVKVNLIQWRVQFVYVNDKKKTLRMSDSPCSKHPKVIKLAGCEIQVDRMDTDFSIRDHRGLVLYVFRAHSPEACGMWFAYIKMLKQNFDPNQLLNTNKKVRWNLRVNPFSHAIQVKVMDAMQAEQTMRGTVEAAQKTAFGALAGELNDALYFSKRAEAKIKLMEMGFDPQAAAGVLVKTSGDVQAALGILTTQTAAQLLYFKELERSALHLLRLGYSGAEAEAALNVTNGNGEEAQRILESPREQRLTDLLAAGSVITMSAGGEGPGAKAQYLDPAAGIHTAMNDRFPGVASPDPKTPTTPAGAAARADADADASASSQATSGLKSALSERSSSREGSLGGHRLAVRAAAAAPAPPKTPPCPPPTLEAEAAAAAVEGEDGVRPVAVPTGDVGPKVVQHLRRNSAPVVAAVDAAAAVAVPGPSPPLSATKEDGVGCTAAPAAAAPSLSPPLLDLESPLERTESTGSPAPPPAPAPQELDLDNLFAHPAASAATPPAAHAAPAMAGGDDPGTPTTAGQQALDDLFRTPPEAEPCATDA